MDFDPAALVVKLDAMGLRLEYVRLPTGELAFAPWGSDGGPAAQKLLIEACVSSANRLELLQHLQALGRQRAGGRDEAT